MIRAAATNETVREASNQTSFSSHALLGGMRPYLLLSLFCALLYLPGLSSIPPLDRDEARFMQATKQMLETRDFINIRFQDEPRNKKPPGIHWLQSAAVAAAGADRTEPWPYRLPSAIAAWLAVLTTCAVGMRLFDRQTGLLAGIVLASSFMLVIEAHIAKTDAALLAATTAAMASLGRLYAADTNLRRPIAWAVMFWAALAAGVLIKGPVVAIVGAATIVALAVADRDSRWLRRTSPLAGIALFLVLTVPWFLATSGAAGGNSFVMESVRGDLLPKLIGGQESHGAPPGTHLAALFFTMWPWSLLAPAALVVGWKRRHLPAVRFCLAWGLATWILFELVPTKLPHYTLPTFPALALLVAFAIRGNLLEDPLRRPLGRIYRGVWFLSTASFAGGTLYAAHTYGPAAAGPAIGAGLALLAAGVVAIRGLRRTPWNAAMLAGASLVFTSLLAAGVIPRLSGLTVSPRLAAAVAMHRPDANTPVAVAGFSEPSLVFLLGTHTLLTDDVAVTDRLLQNRGSIGILDSDKLNAASVTVNGAGGVLQELARVQGYNYSRGAPVRLSIVTVPSTAEPAR